MKLTTAIGREIDPAEPEKEFSIKAISRKDLVLEIAEGLSLVHRFSGQLGPLTVAQHSLAVSNFFFPTRPSTAIFGLFHDAPEAYLGDMPTPLKRIMPGYSELEKRYLQAIMVRFLRSPISLPTVEARKVTVVSVHKADQWAFVSEVSARAEKMPAYGVTERLFYGGYKPEKLMSAATASRKFVARAAELIKF